ncbi:TIGR00730 family Rossman fold protein [Advenella sp. EE-W14]|uniref:LOG family protein n=1 Tax=Advenella sp. EE-W14 TaxID=2722705 RepID=UPI00145DC85E|nr:TIGR00730 family Rossman fold protein [Advenella sp. EE-W14]
MIDYEKRKALQKNIKEGVTYRLAQEDLDFLASDELRGQRLELEYLKTDKILNENCIRSTVVVFGSARISSPEEAKSKMEQIEKMLDGSPQDEVMLKAHKRAERNLRNAHYYEQAIRFAKMISEHFQKEGVCDYVIMTGGGPGIMEAANRGAYESQARSIGLNITLPYEQTPNPFITPELAFRFHYFAIRKMHFLVRAKALVVFPGGYGTMDELFEVLTLVQTKKMDPIPIILFGSEFWKRAIDFEFLVDEGMINEHDLALFKMVDSIEEAFTMLQRFHAEHM